MNRRQKDRHKDALALPPLPQLVCVGSISPARHSSGMSVVPGEEFGAKFIIIVQILLNCGSQCK